MRVLYLQNEFAINEKTYEKDMLVGIAEGMEKEKGSRNKAIEIAKNALLKI